MPLRFAVLIIELMLIYSSIAMSCAWFYKVHGLENENAILFSVDTITCSARFPATMPFDPNDANAKKDVPLPSAIKRVAACEALWGHLFFPLLVAYLFANRVSPRASR